MNAHAPPLHLAHASGADTGLVAGAVVLVALLAVHAVLRRGATAAGTGRRDSVTLAAIAVGTGAVLVALSSPMDDAATTSFTAHMAQHLLLMSVAAPVLAAVGLHRLVVHGAGLDRHLGTLDRRTRGWPRPVVMAQVVAATLCAVGVLVVWHLPVAYEAALSRTWVHRVEHLTMVVGTYWFWAVVLRRRTAPTLALAAIGVAAVAHGLLGGLLTFATRPLYPSYVAGAGRDAATALSDQQLAGLLMWVPGGVVHLVAVAAVVVWALERSRHRVELREQARRVVRSPSAAVLVLVVLLAGCGQDTAVGTPVEGGDPDAGAQLIGSMGCGSCHRVPGVAGADGRVGPPLDAFGERVYIAGELTNTPENLVRWIMDPQEVNPGGGMPDVGATEDAARHMAAYLLSLEG